MELRHLRYFSVLAECENFTRAAERLFITQSTLSHTIKQLEEELGLALFDRVGKRVSLNKDGSLFLHTVSRTLQELDSGIVDLRQSAIGTLSGELHVGTVHTFNLTLIPQCMFDFLTLNPTVKLRVSEFSAAELERKVLDGTFDLSISYAPSQPDDFWYEPLYNEEFVLIVRPDHAFAARKRIRMVELHRTPLILPAPAYGNRVLLDSCFRSVRAEPHVVAELNSIVPTVDLVRRMGIPAILAYTAIESVEGMPIVRIEDPKPIRTPVLLWKKNSPQSPAARMFADIVKRTAMRFTDPLTHNEVLPK